MSKRPFKILSSVCYKCCIEFCLAVWDVTISMAMCLAFLRAPQQQILGWKVNKIVTDRCFLGTKSGLFLFVACLYF